jgi:hypothetical protein
MRCNAVEIALKYPGNISKVHLVGAILGKESCLQFVDQGDALFLIELL